MKKNRNLEELKTIYQAPRRSFASSCSLQEPFSSSQPGAHSIDEVVTRLVQIIARSACEEDSLGYFAALYRVTTIRIREGIHGGRFEDAARMERLVVLFANRYLEALERFRSGEQPSKCWFVSFNSATEPNLRILDHLLLGMNAHINFDLAIAAAESCTRGELTPLKRDFDVINEILAEALTEVREQILGPLRLRSMFYRLLFAFDDSLVNFSMACARARAWRLGERLSSTSRNDWGREVAKLDRKTAMLSNVICGFAGCLNVVGVMV